VSSQKKKVACFVILILFLFTSGLAGGTSQEGPEPSLEVKDVEVSSLNQLTVTFSARVQGDGAKRLSSYHLSTIGQPSAVAVADDGLSVLLAFTLNMRTDREYTLTIEGIDGLPRQDIEIAVVESMRLWAMEEKILKRSITVKMNENTLIILESGHQGLLDARNALWDAYRELDDQLRSLPPLELPYVDPPAGSAQERMNELVEEAYWQVRDSLESNRTALMDQMINVEYQRSDMNWNIAKFRTQSEAILAQLTWAAENYIFLYHVLGHQQENLLGNRELLEKQLSIARVQERFGMIRPADVRSIEIKLLELEHGQKTLALQQDNMKRELNALLGQPHGTPIEIKTIEANIEVIFDTVDEEKDRKIALDSNLALQALRQDVASKHEVLVRTTDQNRVRAAEMELQNARLKLEEESRRFVLSFTRQHEELMTKHSALSLEREKAALEEVKFRHVQLRHTLGLIPEVDFLTQSLAWENQLRRLVEVEEDLLKSYRKYYWLTNGLSL
jgi:hypothetical protein